MKLFGKKKENLTWYGKTYESKEALRAAQKQAMKSAREKKKEGPKLTMKKVVDFVKGDKFKKKDNVKASATSKKANTAASEKMKAAEKTYAKESMFAKAADNRDKAKTTPGKARPFKEAFEAATKAGKERFLHKGKSYLTTKGKRAERFPVTTDKKSAATPKKSLREKLTGFKTQKAFEEARDKRRIEKRIANIKKRKNAGKSFSAKNLKELEAKLAAN